jgi:glycosyltransferase involved in cell wall biosynthesis
MRLELCVRLDVIVPTYNRARLLTRLLDSLRAADRPDDLSVRVIVVDNNSSDDTRTVVESCQPLFGQKPIYLYEPQLGQCVARNRGLQLVSGDLVGFLDDDEQVDHRWFATVREVFDDPGIDFISGPYEPEWTVDPPAWLPKGYRAVIGWVDAGDEVLTYGKNYDGIMMAGNAVVRRAFVERVGPFNTRLGRIGRQLTAGEDADYHQRLIAAGARGFYIPRLVIYHHIPKERVTKRYHRRWCFYRGISLAQINRERPEPVAHLCGVPRYLFGNAIRSSLKMARALCSRRPDPERIFSSELPLWDLAGFAYGKFFVRRAPTNTRTRRDQLSCPAVPPSHAA